MPTPRAGSYHVVSDPTGAILMWMKLAAIADERARQATFMEWAKAQNPFSPDSQTRGWAGIGGRPTASIGGILDCLSKMGWLTNFAEATLADGEQKLLAARLVRSTTDGMLGLTGLGTELLADYNYGGYLGAASARADYWRQSNVRVCVPGEPGIGSGFFVRSHHVVTARHVVDDLGPLRYDVIDEAGRVYKAIGEERHPDPDVDLACIRVEPAFDGKPMLLGTRPRLLEEVVAFGYPPVAQIADILLCTRGEVAAITRAAYGRGREIFLLSCLIRPGNSGGPVIGESGLVLGVVARNFHHQTPRGDAASVDLSNALGMAAAFPAGYLQDIASLSEIG